MKKKALPTLVHFMKIIDDEYLCKICKATTLKEVKVKRDRSIKLWKHLENFHIKI